MRTFPDASAAHMPLIDWIDDNIAKERIILPRRARQDWDRNGILYSILRDQNQFKFVWGIHHEDGTEQKK